MSIYGGGFSYVEVLCIDYNFPLRKEGFCSSSRVPGFREFSRLLIISFLETLYAADSQLLWPRLVGRSLGRIILKWIFKD